MEPREPGKALSQVVEVSIEGGDAHLRKLRGNVRDWQIACVCGGTHLDCNAGWMKRLEDQARPILIPLIKGERTRLSPSDQATLAAWASLKSMVSEADYGQLITHHMQRKRMMRRQLPPSRNWAVWLGSYDRQRWKANWISQRFLILPLTTLNPYGRPKYYNSAVTTQVIGKLFIQVVHSPMRFLVNGWRFALPHGGTLFRIWPPATFSVGWPGKVMTDLDADTADAINEYLITSARRSAAHQTQE